MGRDTLKVTDIDYWENDAFLEMGDEREYFQFNTLRVGDVFTIDNPDKPAWCEGKFVVTELSSNGYKVKRL